MLRRLIALSFIFQLSIVNCQLSFSQLSLEQSEKTDYASFVNPFIGTGGHGHTFPGATVPFGMVQLSPDTRIDGSWDGCSGYHYSDKKIYGFSHTHLSGTGCSDYGDVMLMPRTVIPKSIVPKMYGETFQHENEKAEAGYYSVKLDTKINCEFTTSTRAGFHKYTYPKSKKGYFVLDLHHRDKLLEGDFKIVDGNKIEGYRISEAWAKKQYVYFVMEFSEPISLILNDSDEKMSKAVIEFILPKNKTIQVKVAISQVSIEGARKNLETEIPHWDFEKTRAEAKALWNKELSKIDVTQTSVSTSSTSAKDQLTIFYTALYHCMIHPSVASDVDGKYRGMDLQIHEAKDFTYYTVFSLWDTFRALHPLFTIIDQKRTNDFIKTFLVMYEQGGRLPVWELSSNETDCMIGYHSVSVIADAFNKNVIDEKLLEPLIVASISSAENDNYRGIGKYRNLGFLGIEEESESVSKSLEYAYDDWCISSLMIDPLNEYSRNKYDFLNRSVSWRNLFDSKTNFIRPRSNGGWLEPFEPREVNNNYTEANAWQYTFFTPHDINTMIDLMGGKENYEKKLDELFSTSSQTTGRDQADITGLIGQYAHGNEPSHHMAYLYAYAGAPQKSQKILHQIKTEFYKNDPDGLIGNEDCGQMSAWYVFSSLGFYPVCPGDPKYVIGAPSFEKAVIHLENGKDFTINAVNIDSNNFYLGGTTHFSIDHEKIMNGGSLSFHMRDTPEDLNKVLDPPTYVFPENKVVSDNFLPVPVISGSGKTFKDSMLISIDGNIKHGTIYYSFEPPCYQDTCFPKVYEYKKPFYINKSCSLWAWVYDLKSAVSKRVLADFHKIENDYTIELKSKYNPQYTAGGDAGIIDGLHGDVDWRKGGWQGYQNQDFECVIDLKGKDVRSISVSFLQDTRAWIFFPTQVEFYYSDDKVNFTKFAEPVIFEKADDNEEPSIKTAKVNYNIIYARYIKVVAKNYGKLPPWHQGYGMTGDNAFIFVDEITIR